MALEMAAGVYRTPRVLILLSLCLLQVDGEEEATGFAAADDDDGPCGGGGGGGGEGGEEAEGECLMRRTLVAHTDYIYTQGGGHN
jgi:hypothetical protein